MKAVRIIAIGQPVEDRELAEPRVGPEDVLVRVRAAGICHSDVHYRSGGSPIGYFPITPGHEVAGVVERVGENVQGIEPGARVCLHYLMSCGRCAYCIRGTEQFCVSGRMIGKHAEGGYAELIAVPARSVVALPDSVSFEHGAALMCSSATAFHALRKARLVAGESVAVIGAGGLGLSAVQLARALGASRVWAVDVNPERLREARELGAVGVDARNGDAAARIRELSGGAGVDVSVEMIGTPATMRQAVAVLGVFGRAALVGITQSSFEVDSYRELIGREAEVIGVSDHLRSELPVLLDMAARGVLDLSRVVTRRVPLDAAAVNEVMDALAGNRGAARTVIVP